ncbi:hypothetical protein TIFTF001_051478 [Ficus carica]|uniref:Uncharacterized protein n=1 Tax=Ficus carica TaxID=3494 RepID=A0AA87YXN7_FICCA|nr:hypothetical protein TIFTF001_051478 [Ficus carica]
MVVRSVEGMWDLMMWSGMVGEFSLEGDLLEILVGGFSGHSFLLFAGMAVSGGRRTLPLTV